MWYLGRHRHTKESIYIPGSVALGFNFDVTRARVGDELPHLKTNVVTDVSIISAGDTIPEGKVLRRLDPD